jgi:hypothetical protein
MREMRKYFLPSLSPLLHHSIMPTNNRLLAIESMINGYLKPLMHTD